jgi:hypothetical protein
MPSYDEYIKLTSIVNQNLVDNNLDEIVFESFDATSKNILAFPIEALLNIESDEQFLYEVYYKMLDRIIDEKSYKYYHNQLKYKKITRNDLINVIFNSDERKIKQTNILFDNGDNI